MTLQLTVNSVQLTDLETPNAEPKPSKLLLALGELRGIISGLFGLGAENDDDNGSDVGGYEIGATKREIEEDEARALVSEFRLLLYPLKKSDIERFLELAQKYQKEDKLYLVGAIKSALGMNLKEKDLKRFNAIFEEEYKKGANPELVDRIFEICQGAGIQGN